jgi:hypothetical protein
MGGSGGKFFSSSEPSAIQKKIKKIQEDSIDQEFEARLSTKINDMLAVYNDRNVEEIKKRINIIVSKLERKAEDEIDVLYGGSVSKHTYVDGLSDIDMLLLVDEHSLSEKKPSQVLKYVEKLLKNKFKDDLKSIEVGALAVTLEFVDGMVIQLLPALRAGKKLKIGAMDGKEWTKIDPQKFQAELTEKNQACANKLVPVIKLAKVINSNLPESQRLSGYHIEALAVGAFENYKGKKDIPNMLVHLFKNSVELVKKPIVDKTGQSNAVDEYLGPANSDKRIQTGYIFDRIYKRLTNALASQSEAQWLDMLGLE